MSHTTPRTTHLLPFPKSNARISCRAFSLPHNPPALSTTRNEPTTLQNTPQHLSPCPLPSELHCRADDIPNPPYKA